MTDARRRRFDLCLGVTFLIFCCLMAGGILFRVVNRLPALVTTPQERLYGTLLVSGVCLLIVVIGILVNLFIVAYWIEPRQSASRQIS